MAHAGLGLLIFLPQFPKYWVDSQAWPGILNTGNLVCDGDDGLQH